MLAGRLIPWRSKSGEPETSDPAPLSRFHSEVDRLFGRFLDEPFLKSSGFPGFGDWQAPYAPSLDVSENETTITVKAELPGVDSEDIDVSIEGDVLTLSGEKKQEKQERREGYYHSERRFGSFRRSIPLPSTVDREKVSAEFDRGVLTVKLEKAVEATARRIPVSVRKK